MPNKATTSSKAAWSIPLLALCLATVAMLLWPSDDTATPTRRESDATSGASVDAAKVPNAAEPTAPASADASDRIPAPELVRTSPPDSSSEPQGLRGTAVNKFGHGLQGVTVYLVESASNDPLLFPLVQQQRHLLAPVANTETAIDGTFAVGLPVAQDKVYDLFLLSEQHATVRMTGLRLLPDTWHDLGPLTMQTGTTIRGKVTVLGQPGMPVPQAVVTVSSGGAFADAALRALPGEQGALIAQVDSNGDYVVEHAPQTGIVVVSAIAPGFARVTNQEVELQADGPTQVDFELPPGKTLAGDVRTNTGLPIANARIEAWPKPSNLPALLGFSDERGTFLLQGLRPGPHTIKATAKGFAEATLVNVEPGQAAHLTMVPQNRILVRVVSPTGRSLRQYRLGLRRFFAKDHAAPLDEQALASGTIGSIHEVPDQRVRLDGTSEQAEILDVPYGTFTCEVEADGFAKTLSLPVQFPAPTEAPEAPDGTPGSRPQTPGSTQRVEVVVTQGSHLRGKVVDQNGMPLAGALVTTQAAGTMPDSPVLRVMQGWVPKRITERNQRTDAMGLFQMDRLALATYQLQVEHPAACRTLVRDLDLRQPGEHTINPIIMPHGSVVSGKATVQGRVAGQMKVILTTESTAPADKSLRLETVTDGEGQYQFARRIPPGTYELRAAVVGSTSPDSEIFQQLLQLQRSSTTFIVPTGQDTVRIDLDAPSAN